MSMIDQIEFAELITRVFAMGTEGYHNGTFENPFSYNAALAQTWLTGWNVERYRCEPDSYAGDLETMKKKMH